MSDIDECAQGKQVHGCDQKCGNTPGSFVCSCNTGYALNINRKSCNDVNECERDKGGCMHKCTNNVGSFSCSCNENFKTDPQNSKLCIPKTPCKDSNHGCQHVCYVNADDQQKCSCNKGYKLNDDGKACNDINECSINEYRCNQKCHNTIGSYTCSCVPGFKLSADNFTCVDINECLEFTFNCTDSSQTCLNTQGSYKCVCEEGLIWINDKCTALRPGATTPPPPTAPAPKQPSAYEVANSVNITMTNLNASQWTEPKEEKFKEVVAKGVTNFCARTKGCVPGTNRVKRALVFVDYQADQVHLLPGYPLQIISEQHKALSLVARIALYVNFPPGVVLNSNNTINQENLLKALNDTRGDIEKALQVKVLTLTAHKPESSRPTDNQEEKDDGMNLYIIIGATVGGVVVIVILLIIIVCCCRKLPKSEKQIEFSGYPNHAMESPEDIVATAEEIVLNKMRAKTIDFAHDKRILSNSSSL